MRYTFINTSTTAGDATTLGVAGQDIYVKKIILGNPTAAQQIKLYDKTVAWGHASGIGSVDDTNVAFNHTVPSAAAGRDILTEFDFTSYGSQGLPLNGGACHTDSVDVTILWEAKDDVA